MEYFMAKAKALAEDTMKKSRDLASETAKYSEKLASDAVASKLFAEEASRRTAVLAEQSMLFADEASKRSRKIAEDAAVKAQAGYKTLVKELAATNLISATKPPAAAVVSEEEKLEYGITSDLCEFVKGLSIETFKDFPIEKDSDPQDSESSAVQTSPSPSAATDIQIKSTQVSQDLTDWQLHHAMLILKIAPEMSKFRYLLCPRVMKEKMFWRVYFQLVKSQVASAEALYDEKKKVPALNAQTQPTEATPPVPERVESDTDHDLDAYLLGSGAGGDDEDDEDFDPDDFDQFVNDVSLDGTNAAQKDVANKPAVVADTTDSDGSDGVIINP